MSPFALFLLILICSSSRQALCVDSSTDVEAIGEKVWRAKPITENAAQANERSTDTDCAYS